MHGPEPIPSVTTEPPASQPAGAGLELPPGIRSRRRASLPWLTFLLIAVNVAVGIAALVIAGFGGAENIAMLTFLGAKVNVLIHAGQYWRLVTAGFLHIGLWHLLSNMMGLLFIGTVVEAFYGRWRYLMLYTLTGAAGMALSYLMQPNLSAGASASVFGLVGALIAHNWKYRRQLPPAIVQRMSILVPIAFIDLAFGQFYKHIDQYGHIGGLAAGLILGLLTESRVAGELQNEREWLPLPAALATALGLLVYAVIGWGLNVPREWPLAQGAMAESRGDPARAAHYYEAALKREPDLGELRAQLAEMLQKQRRDEEERAQLREMLRRGYGGPATEGRYFQILFDEANRFSADHQPREAATRYREALPHAPDARSRALVQNNLAYVEADELRERYQEALQMANAATTAEPNNGIYRDTLAWVYYRLGRFADAEQEQRLALRQIAPGPLPALMGNQGDEPVLRYHLGAILEAEGKTAAAVDEYERAVSLGRNSENPELQKAVQEAQSALRRLGK